MGIKWSNPVGDIKLEAITYFKSSSIRSIQREVKRFHRTMLPPSNTSKKALR